MRRQTRAPLWLMGLANGVFGMYGGIMVISVPQLLSARQVPESTIAAMTAVMISPGIWAFLASPVLDVRFSRRWYSIATSAAAAVLLVLALLNLDHLALVEVLLVTGYFFANLYQSALGGWLSTAGSYAADAAVTMISSVLLATLLIWLTRRKNMRPLVAAGTSP